MKMNRELATLACATLVALSPLSNTMAAAATIARPSQEARGAVSGVPLVQEKDASKSKSKKSDAAKKGDSAVRQDAAPATDAAKKSDAGAQPQKATRARLSTDRPEQDEMHATSPTPAASAPAVNAPAVSAPALVVAPAGDAVADAAQANRRGQLSEEEAAVVPYYNNFMASYRLGPEDVISIRVFDQERYSMGNVTIPPDGRVSYWFVRDGIMVTGKTTQQVSEEITKHLDEYIIEPKVTVTLEKAMSARYGVIGDVAQPGIRVITRRLSVYEALMEAGGVLPTGDKKRVVVLRQQANGSLQSIPVDISAIEKGRALNNVFVGPGDQVVVPGNRFKSVQKVLSLLPILSFARIFTGGW